ncbi:MAG: hypothetical protein QW423_01185 [Candidatus Aenigmatarchaeota archaeon]
MGKGLDAPVMIGIILAIIVAGIIIYFLWSKGFLPFLSGGDESTCRTYLISACSGEEKFWARADVAGCKRFFTIIGQDSFESCSSDFDCRYNLCKKLLP